MYMAAIPAILLRLDGLKGGYLKNISGGILPGGKRLITYMPDLTKFMDLYDYTLKDRTQFSL